MAAVPAKTVDAVKVAAAAKATAWQPAKAATCAHQSEELGFGRGWQGVHVLCLSHLEPIEEAVVPTASEGRKRRASQERSRSGEGEQRMRGFHS